MITKFEDIIAWQKARVFVNGIYKEFGNCKDFGFRGQILRASVSIVNNVAEGFEKRSNKELRKYLNISKGSCGEVRSMLYLASDIGYLKKEDFDILYNQTVELSKIITGFSKSLIIN